MFPIIFLKIPQVKLHYPVAYKFFQTLGITTAEIIVEDLRKEFLNSKIGIEVEDNEAKDGRIFHNIVDFFEIEDESDIDNEEEDDFDEDEDEDDEDSETEDLEETDSFDNEDSGHGEDVLEGNLSESAIKSARRRNNKRRNSRR